MASSEDPGGPGHEDADRVDAMLEQWARERPDLDASPIGVIGRLHRVADRLTAELVAEYARFGLGEGEFDVLATLRRSGPPYAMAAGDLATATMVTTGAVSKRVDRCEQQGWVERNVADGDGRGRVVALTAAGRELIDRAVTAHLANEQRLLADLGAKERELLAGLLRRWGRALGVE